MAKFSKISFLPLRIGFSDFLPSKLCPGRKKKVNEGFWTHGNYRILWKFMSKNVNAPLQNPEIDIDFFDFFRVGPPCLWSKVVPILYTTFYLLIMYLSIFNSSSVWQSFRHIWGSKSEACEGHHFLQAKFLKMHFWGWSCMFSSLEVC